MKDFTFVLISCGELAEEKCLKAIQPFRDEIELIEIRNVFPQIKMLNQMVESVQSPYFIPLDADICLYEDAWDRIMNAWRKHWRNPNWHSILFSLWDTLTERKILALKILRTEIIKQFPFQESATPDVEHFQRLTKAGFTCIQDYLRLRPIGDHVVAGKQFCYFKYRDVYQTYRAHNFDWDSAVFMGGDTLREKAKNHFDFFLYKLTMTKNSDYLNCIAGMMDGILSEAKNQSKTLEKQEYLVETKDAMDTFFKWYLEEEPLKHPEALLF